MSRLLLILCVLLSLLVTGCGARIRSMNATATAQSLTATALPLAATGQSPPTSAAVTTSEDILFQDDFQDGRPDDWTITAGWVVQQDGDRYTFATAAAGGAAVIRGRDWRDYRFQTLVRVTAGGVALGYRVTPDSRYYVHWRSDGLFLGKEYPRQTFTPLTQAAAPGFNAWHTLAISGFGGHIQVSVDGNVVLDYTDPTPLLSGTVSLAALDGYQAAVDDVLVTRLTAPLPVPPPAALPPTLPPPATPLPFDVNPPSGEPAPATPQPPPPPPPTQPPPQPPPATPTIEEPAAPPPQPEPPTVEEPAAPPSPAEPPVIDYFTSEPATDPGCYYLHWDLHGATAAYLNGNGVVAPGSEEVCPARTGQYVYTLTAVNQSGQVEQTITFEQPPPPANEEAPPVGEEPAAPPEEEEEEPAAPPPDARPDLVFGDVSVSVPAPARPWQVSVTMEVRNQGDGPAGAFTVRWYPDEEPFVVGCSQDVSGLPAASAVALHCTYAYQQSGEHHWRVLVDADNDITNELNESNNSQRGTIILEDNE